MENFMSIETYGVGKRMELVSKGLKNQSFSHLVVLPIPSTKDNKHITNTDILLEQTLVNVSVGSKIVGYGLPEEYKERAIALGAEVYDAGFDEIFLLKNAYLTALGALGYILSTVDRELAEIRFGIFGYGRIGRILAQMLLFLGAKLTVYTSKFLSRVELGTYGIDSSEVSYARKDACVLDGLDILINTAPTDMSGICREAKIPRDVRVIELASGNNFSGIEGVERLPGIPEKSYPESAARAYLEAIIRLAREEKK
jgi:dipicolinate synthase subunit A